MKMTVLTRDFGTSEPSKQFKITNVEAENREEIWEEIENSLINSNTQAWVMSEEEFKALEEILNKQMSAEIQGLQIVVGEMNEDLGIARDKIRFAIQELKEFGSVEAVAELERC